MKYDFTKRSYDDTRIVGGRGTEQSARYLLTLAFYDKIVTLKSPDCKMGSVIYRYKVII